MNTLKLETVMTETSTTITALFTSRSDLERFLGISSQLLELFPPELAPSEPPPVDNAFVAEGCEQFWPAPTVTARQE